MEIKKQALLMYVNNVGIRKAALFCNVSPTSVLRWIKGFAKALREDIKTAAENLAQEKPDVIEMDEIYTFIKKTKRRGEVYRCLVCL